MTIEQRLIERLDGLYWEGRKLEVLDKDGTAVDVQQMHECLGWVAAVENAVHLCGHAGTPYQRAFDDQFKRVVDSGWGIPLHVGALRALIERFLEDARAGLLSSLANVARAEVFDDFLDHAKHYHRNGKKNEAGTIAGVVFEDTIRRLCDKHGIPQKDVQLDRLIVELTNRGVISSTRSRRARTAAHVRNKATHAQWDEFELGAVEETIRFTTELVELLEA